MKLFNSLLVSLASLVAAANAGKFTPAHDEFKKNDEIQIQCVQIDGNGREVTEKDSLKYLSPTCVETYKPLSVYYGYDGPIQCSIKNDDPFHETMLRSIALDKPLRCRMARNKLSFPKYMDLPIRIEGARASGKRASEEKRIAGSFNAVFHGQNGNLIAASVYPVVDHALPQTVGGVSTIQITQKWYEGAGMSTLMANKRHEEEFIIQPIVALMFCILTACIVYVAGRVYVESSVIPRAIKDHIAERDGGGSGGSQETKKTQ
ncbi:hypothetical protein IW140_005145 [Coemansia sp. RSA 1813]|nr:hypothetical protein EV178_005122 [Coemansia sp. RSA 1646]KAJ1768118.1 hypothetical protein LPJ74_005017 [Coemansia sp. RSA 1843]KAJ2088024.1 hypothetical protein IW138_004532 [Coemansia sp. RSA 986]KAJ2211957.1 hypothetical protein EV179_005064 [Coemansia sp. RSA 487]KAJ2565863.1 hypothetical protein IW140_005145 [Coemansia sp. RSA 1813]